MGGSTLGRAPRIRGDEGIFGTGSIEFLAGANRLLVPEGASTIRIGPHITVHGALATIGTTGVPLINEGTIHADRPGLLRIRASDWTNDGLLRTSAGGAITTDNAWTNNGKVHVGDDAPLECQDGYTQSPSGTLIIDKLIDPGADRSGVLVVTGTASFDGTIFVEFGNVSTSVGGMFTVAEYDDRVGEFASIESESLDENLMLVPTYGPNALVVTIEARN